jgi:excisionase family DNA binding protein
LAPPPKNYVSTTTAAEHLSVSTETIRRLIAAGRLPAVRIGTDTRSHFRIPGSGLDRLLRSRKVEPKS